MLRSKSKAVEAIRVFPFRMSFVVGCWLIVIRVVCATGFLSEVIISLIAFATLLT